MYQLPEVLLLLNLFKYKFKKIYILFMFICNIFVYFSLTCVVFNFEEIDKKNKL